MDEKSLEYKLENNTESESEAYEIAWLLGANLDVLKIKFPDGCDNFKNSLGSECLRHLSTIRQIIFNSLCKTMKKTGLKIDFSIFKGHDALLRYCTSVGVYVEGWIKTYGIVSFLNIISELVSATYPVVLNKLHLSPLFYVYFDYPMFTSESLKEYVQQECTLTTSCGVHIPKGNVIKASLPYIFNNNDIALRSCCSMLSISCTQETIEKETLRLNPPNTQRAEFLLWDIDDVLTRYTKLKPNTEASPKVYKTTVGVVKPSVVSNSTTEIKKSPDVSKVAYEGHKNVGVQKAVEMKKPIVNTYKKQEDKKVVVPQNIVKQTNKCTSIQPNSATDLSKIKVATLGASFDKFMQVKTEIFVDCDNIDFFKFVTFLHSMSSLEHISCINLFVDVKSSFLWKMIKELYNGKLIVNLINVQRIKEHKSVVDVVLACEICKKVYLNGLSNVLLVSSDSDFFGLIQGVSQASFGVCYTAVAMSSEYLEYLKSYNVSSFCLDNMDSKVIFDAYRVKCIAFLLLNRLAVISMSQWSVPTLVDNVIKDLEKETELRIDRNFVQARITDMLQNVSVKIIDNDVLLSLNELSLRVSETH